MAERNEKKKREKNGAELEMGYCPLSMRLGAKLGARHSDTARRRSGGVRGTQARRRRHGRAGAGRWARWASGRVRQADTGQARGRDARKAGTRCRRAARARGRQSRGARQARGTRPAGRPGRDLGVQLGEWAVHSVHSACFWPGSTR